MMDFDYTVKVYADTIEDGYRTIESVPTEYKKAVKAELDKRGCAIE